MPSINQIEQEVFDDILFDIPRLYTSACSYAVQPVRLYPIVMSILLYHFKQLTQCISEAERIEAKLNSKNKELLTKEKEKEKQEAPATTLDSYFIKNNANFK
jgi:hypothetical protein